MGSLTLALFLGAVRCVSGAGAYGCHLPARGGPPTCAGLLLAWWCVGGAVVGRGRFAARCALLQQALDFMQLFFLDLCFTALFFEVPAPL